MTDIQCIMREGRGGIKFAVKTEDTSLVMMVVSFSACRVCDV